MIMIGARQDNIDSILVLDADDLVYAQFSRGGRSRWEVVQRKGKERIR